MRALNGVAAAAAVSGAAIVAAVSFFATLTAAAAAPTRAAVDGAVPLRTTPPTANAVADAILGRMDRSVDPCTDFYRYACGATLDRQVAAHAATGDEDADTAPGPSVELQLRGQASLTAAVSAGGALAATDVSTAAADCEASGRALKAGNAATDLAPLAKYVAPLAALGAVRSTADLYRELGRLVALNPFVHLLVRLWVRRGPAPPGASTCAEVVTVSIDIPRFLDFHSSEDVAALLRAARCAGLLGANAYLPDAVRSARSLGDRLDDLSSDVFFDSVSVKEEQFQVWTASNASAAFDLPVAILTAAGALPPGRRLLFEPSQLPYFSRLAALLPSFADDEDGEDEEWPRVGLGDLQAYLATRIVKHLAGEDQVLGSSLLNATGRFPSGRSCIREAWRSTPATVAQWFVATHVLPSARATATLIAARVRNATVDAVHRATWLDAPTRTAVADAIGRASVVDGTDAVAAAADAAAAVDDFDVGVGDGNGSCQPTPPPWAALFPNVRATSYSNTAWDDRTGAVVVPALLYSWPYLGTPARGGRGGGSGKSAAVATPPVPDAVTYGRLGWEIGSAFAGGLGPDTAAVEASIRPDARPWWSPASVAAWEARRDCVIDLYGRFTVPETGEPVAALSAVDQSVADATAASVALAAFRAERRAATAAGAGGKSGAAGVTQDAARSGGGKACGDGGGGGGDDGGESARWAGGVAATNPRLAAAFTDEQLFWVSVAQGRCTWESKVLLDDMLGGSPVAPRRYRVRGALGQSADFAAAWACPAGSVYNPADKCSVW